MKVKKFTRYRRLLSSFRSFDRTIVRSFVRSYDRTIDLSNKPDHFERVKPFDYIKFLLLRLQESQSVMAIRSSEPDRFHEISYLPLSLSPFDQISLSLSISLPSFFLFHFLLNVVIINTKTSFFSALSIRLIVEKYRYFTKILFEETSFPFPFFFFFSLFFFFIT